MRRDPLYSGRAREMRSNATDAERRMWEILRAKRMGGFKFRRQHPLGQYIVDFICLPARLVIEVDGDTHGDEREMADQKRTDYIEKVGLRVIRFSNYDVLHCADDVADAIAHELDIGASAVLSSPLREAGVNSPLPFGERVGEKGLSPRSVGQKGRERGVNSPSPLQGRGSGRGAQAHAASGRRVVRGA